MRLFKRYSVHVDNKTIQISSGLTKSIPENSPVSPSASKGFITCTGILVMFVSLLLLVSIALLVSQMWQNSISDNETFANISIPQSDSKNKIQLQKSLRQLQKKIHPNGVISHTDFAEGERESAIIVQLESASDAETKLYTQSIKKPEPKDLYTDPDIYNQTISGRVLTSEGDFLPGIIVTARYISQSQDGTDLHKNQSTSKHQRIIQVESGSQGDFDFESLEAGLYRISATLKTNEIYKSQIVHSGVKSMDLVLPTLQIASITGNVTDDFGMPLEGVRVRLVPGKTQVYSDVHGRFFLDSSLSDDINYQIKFDASGYAPTFVRLNDESQSGNGSKNLISARLKTIIGTTTIAGRITDIKGNLLSGQRVRLVSPSTNTQELVFSDYYGEFRFEQVIAGADYVLGVSPDEKYRPWVQRDIHITPASKYFELVLEPMTETGTLQGRVVDTSGNPVPEFSLTVKANAAGNHKISVRSDKDGYFLVHDVPAGSLALRTLAEPEVLLTNLSLQPGATKQITVPVDWGKEELIGRLVDLAGKPVAGVNVSLKWSQREGRSFSQTRRQSRTDKSGSFRFTNLGAGEHFLSVSGNKVEPVSKQVNVGADNAIQRIVIQRTAT